MCPWASERCRWLRPGRVVRMPMAHLKWLRSCACMAPIQLTTSSGVVAWVADRKWAARRRLIASCVVIDCYKFS